MTRIRLVLSLAAAALISLSLASQAAATIYPLPQGSEAAKKAGEAILEEPAQLIGAELPEYAYSEEEPAESPIGVADGGSPLAGFPTFGSSYAILSSGNIAKIAGDQLQNYPEANSYLFGGEASLNPEARGVAHDWTVLKMDVSVPVGSNCLALDYRFLSEEYPEYVESPFNDAFIAELDSTNNWRVNEDGTLTRPSDFASSPTGEPISVNGVGPTAMSPAEAEGTYFNAATGLITTKTPVTAGPNSIYLSIFDASDEKLDSAVFLDNLRFIAEAPETCKPPIGAQLAIPVEPVTPSPPPPASSSTPPPAAPPSNSFTVGTGSQVKFKGGSEATLTVSVPGPGTVSAGSPTSSSGIASSLVVPSARASVAKAKRKKKPFLIPATVQVARAGTVALTVKLSSTGKQLLAKKHKLSVPVTITFTPTGGTAASQTTTLKFTAKAKKPKKK